MKTAEKFAGFVQHTGKGVCFAHGPYGNADKSFGCPKWPACITEPHKPEYVAMGTKELRLIAEVRKRNPEWSAILEQAVESETAGLRALVGELADALREWSTEGGFVETELLARAEEARKP